MKTRRILAAAVIVPMIAVLFALSLFSGCQTEPPVVEEGTTPAKIFQLAQEAYDRYDYRTALHYYETFLERYPEDLENGLAARYEIAFIRYKMGELQEAKTLFDRLLARYAEIPDAQVPSWPRVLSVKILEQIEQQLEAEAEPAQPELPPAAPAAG